mgnify:CR=1 FL=1
MDQTADSQKDRTTNDRGSNFARYRLHFLLAVVGLLVYCQHRILPQLSELIPATSSIRSVSLSGHLKNQTWTELLLPPEQQSEPNNESEKAITADWKKYKNRTITFVHVGKAGGMTLRRATSLRCRLRTKETRNQTDAELEPCMMQLFSPNATLPRQVRHYFHMYAYQQEQLERSTSFLFVLRNPVDRIISTYRYSHPENCPQNKSISATTSWGCHVAKFLKERPRSQGYEEYSVCFPSPAMEDFAQSVMSPWKDRSSVILPNNKTKTYTFQQQLKCRQLARNLVEGQGRERPNPHMKYNYLYYQKKTLDAFPEKEIFGIRTEHEWEDLMALDKSLGGTGVFPNRGNAFSHGSESYAPSPLSNEAYQKLCCVLNADIAVYQNILDHVLNLDETQKRECMEDVKQKCGITSSWGEWRKECQIQLDKDQEELKRLKR